MSEQPDELTALDASDEVNALITALHATVQRLEDLTGGEVDTVANPQGLAFLLPQAQHHGRITEAARQAAILNALPAHVALIDQQGRIISINEAWRQFGIANAQHDLQSELGSNYLDVCDKAQGEHAQEAQEVARCIRSVLAGDLTSYALEYPCHSPTQQRWFQMSVTPVGTVRQNGAVVMHLNVTSRRMAEDSWRASELRFRQMAENISDIFFLADADSYRILYISAAYEVVTGRSCADLYARSEVWFEAIHPQDRAAAQEKFRRHQQSGSATSFHDQYRIQRLDGSVRWLDVRTFPVRDGADQLVRIAGVATDVTERQLAETRIQRLNRLYALLSGINGLIVRTQDREELFQRVCLLAVEQGGFAMAWIGVVDPQTLQGKVVAWHGNSSAFVDTVHLTGRADSPFSERPASRALRLMRPVVCNDIANDLAAADVRDDMLSWGYQSLACFALSATGEPDAVLALKSSECNVFDDEEMKLLTELAGDISFALDHIEKADRLKYLAYYDALTGLANRSLFLERAAQYLRDAEQGGYGMAVFIVDIERFKNINDSMGQAAGDALLIQVGIWAVRHAGDAMMVARIDADHFALVMPRIRADGDMEHFTEATLSAFNTHVFRLHDAVFRISAKIGVAIFPEAGSDAETLFKRAEAALKHAKSHGDSYVIYTQSLSDAVKGKPSLENQLRQAIDNQEFVLHYQPKVSLLTGKMVGAEALIRWNDPVSGLVSPAHFIPVLEETGLIHAVGRWALHEATSDYLRWSDMGLSPVRIAVNVSPLQLRHRNFLNEVQQVLALDIRVAAGLELEITESVIMENVAQSLSSLGEMRAMGVSIAIDDFGTGFSSLSYLSKLPIDTLKIDRSFVVDMTTGPQGLALVSHIINLAHALKLKVVAEGVETAEQTNLLRLMGCDQTQGFLFSRPLAADAFEKQLRESHLPHLVKGRQTP
ncbi:MAG: EAL domain-containing protein [Rhodoferax sp.]|nr:EAL domain-containing protein [Rhodoferax sp.]